MGLKQTGKWKFSDNREVPPGCCPQVRAACQHLEAVKRRLLLGGSSESLAPFAFGCYGIVTVPASQGKKDLPTRGTHPSDSMRLTFTLKRRIYRWPLASSSLPSPCPAGHHPPSPRGGSLRTGQPRHGSARASLRFTVTQ